MCVCMCVRVSEFLAQQARIRAATLVRALGMCVCVSVCMWVACMSVFVCLAQQARTRAATLVQALGVCAYACMYVCVCVCVYVCVYTAQQAGIRAATLI